MASKSHLRLVTTEKRYYDPNEPNLTEKIRQIHENVEQGPDYYKRLSKEIIKAREEHEEFHRYYDYDEQDFIEKCRQIHESVEKGPNYYIRLARTLHVARIEHEQLYGELYGHDE